MNKPLYRDPNLQIVFLVTLMAVLGVSTIAPVLPAVAKALALSAKEASWLIAIFTLPGILFAPLFGYWGDRWGGEVLVPCLLLFAGAGTACAFARDYPSLLVLRFLQGIGAGALGVVNLTIIGDLYEGRDRVEAMGMNAGFLSLGTALYPALGGLLAVLGWSYPFFLSLLGFPVAWLVAYRLRHEDPQTPADVRAVYFQNLLQLFRRGHSLRLFAGLLASFIIIYGICLTVFPFFLQSVFSFSPLRIGLLLAVMSLGSMASSWRLRSLHEKWGRRRILVLGFLLYGVCQTVIPLVRFPLASVACSFTFGIAHGMLIPMIQSALAELAKPHNRASVMSMSGMVLRIGQTLGPLGFSWLYEWSGITGAFFAGVFLSLSICILCSATDSE